MSSTTGAGQWWRPVRVRSRGRVARWRPFLEPLEDRLLPSVAAPREDNIPSTAAHVVTFQGDLSIPGEVDVFPLVAPVTGQLTAVLRPAATDSPMATLTVRDGAGQVLASSGNGTSVRLAVTGGLAYLFEVTGAGSGGYEVDVAIAAVETGEARFTLTPLDLGGPPRVLFGDVAPAPSGTGLETLPGLQSVVSTPAQNTDLELNAATRVDPGGGDVPVEPSEEFSPPTDSPPREPAEAPNLAETVDAHWQMLGDLGRTAAGAADALRSAAGTLTGPGSPLPDEFWTDLADTLSRCREAISRQFRSPVSFTDVEESEPPLRPVAPRVPQPGMPVPGTPHEGMSPEAMGLLLLAAGALQGSGVAPQQQPQHEEWEESDTPHPCEGGK